MSIGFWQIAIVVILVVLLFGRGKISSLMGDVAKGIKSFKKGMANDGEDSAPKNISENNQDTDKKEVVAKAEGEASRFIAIYNEYKNAKAVTQERMYLETMEKVLADIDKVIIEKNAGSGVVPYLPLPELKKKATN